MANPGYVRSTDGLDTDNGSTWALANATAVGAMVDAVAGDRIWFSDAHAEAQAASMTITSPGTVANPCQFLCGDDVADPLTALATTALIEVTGAFNITVSGSLYARGFRFFVNGSNSSAGLIILGNSVASFKQIYELCKFDLNSISSAGRIHLVGTNASGVPSLDISNGEFKFGHALQGFRASNGKVNITNCTFTAGTTAITELIKEYGNGGRSADVNFVGCDFAGLSSSLVILNTTAISGNGTVLLRGCKMPTSWSGTLISGALAQPGVRVELYNCDSGDTNYKTWIESYAGTIRDDSGIYLSGTDGIKHNTLAVPLSYKMTGSTSASTYNNPLNGMWLVLVNESTASQTATLEVIHNESANLNDDEIWLEVEYPVTAGSTRVARLTDSAANILATPAPQATSTADWDDGVTERANSTVYAVGNIVRSTGSPGSAFIVASKSGTGTSAASEPAGFTGAVDGDSITDNAGANQIVWKALRRQKLQVTFTAAEQGVIRVRPVLAKANAVVWVASKVSLA